MMETSSTAALVTANNVLRSMSYVQGNPLDALAAVDRACALSLVTRKL